MYKIVRPGDTIQCTFCGDINDSKEYSQWEVTKNMIATDIKVLSIPDGKTMDHALWIKCDIDYSTKELVYYDDRKSLWEEQLNGKT